jgi:hypothetical protein
MFNCYRKCDNTVKIHFLQNLTLSVRTVSDTPKFPTERRAASCLLLDGLSHMLAVNG